jgi:GntR family transcriptional regulator
MRIDRDLPIPLYFQLKQLLLSRLESQELQAGDPFPTEQQIQDIYGVSRTTVRQALSELEEEGRINRQRGRGTFVTKPKLSHSPDEYPSLADNMTTQGIVPGWKLRTAEWVQPDPSVYDALQLTHGEDVFLLERIRMENDQPIGHHSAYVPTAFTDGIDGTAYTRGGSLRYLSGLDFLPDCIADRTLEALLAPPDIAELLDIQPGSALFRVKRTVYSPNGVPVEYFVGLYRGDRFEYHIHNMRAISTVNA